MKNLNKLLLKHAPIGALHTIYEAKRTWAAFRGLHGAKATATPLLTHPDANHKFALTPVPVYGLSLAQDKSSGEYSLCDYSTPECRAGCVAFAGQGEAPNVQEGRKRKTQFLAECPEHFVTLLYHEIKAAGARHPEHTVGVRLNAFSDLEWERIAPVLFVSAPENVTFYDYTKRPYGSRQTPSNYHLTYSVSEKTTTGQLLSILWDGGNVAMVTNVRKGEPMPEKLAIPADDGTYHFTMIDGDASDARYVDASMGDGRGVVIGLRAKGRMRKNRVGGMVRAV